MNDSRAPQARIDEVVAWNIRYLIGTPVTVAMDGGQTVRTVTTSVAVMHHEQPAVNVQASMAGPYALSQVKPITADSKERGG